MDQHTPTPSLLKNCTNCDALTDADDNWCPCCGQKAYKGPPSFWQLMSEFFETVFNLDNRLFRTLATLVIPGRLTNYFLKGKQRPYFHPMRLFFVSGVLMVAAYSFYTSGQVGDSLDESLKSRQEQAYKHQFEKDLVEGLDSIKTSFPGASVTSATDSLLHLLGYNDAENDGSFSIGYMEYEGGLSFNAREVRLSYDDLQILSPAELVEKYEVTGAFNQYQFKQIVRINRLNLSGLTTMMSQIIWGLLLLVPLAAGMLKLFYIRNKRRYVEHFIFTLHVHSFLFITQFLAALGLLIFDSPWFLTFSTLAIVVYFLLALKRVYGQGWGKTLVKAAMMGWGYFFLLVFTISITAVLAVLLF